ncbi:helix-turn-helix transcriptional regulator [Sphaerisporangium sp. B11E5]|uniref:helix-turn-helix domain-containing protein n=1 Tax=Sphaerisporangium sp. B11E5 TaxID=3153563 RepID=UPI00325E9C42
MAGPAEPGNSGEWVEFGSALREFRKRSGMSLREIADRIRWHYSLIGKWEQGKNRPPADAVMALDKELGSGGELVARALHAAMADMRRGTIETNSESADKDDEMERRAAIRLLTALSAGAVIPPGVLEDVLAGTERALGERVHIDDWDRTVHEYDHLIATWRGGSLIKDLTAEVVAVGRLLGQRNPPLIQAGLLRVSARLSGMLAKEFGAVNDVRAARVAWRTARHAADDSGDRDLSVWIRTQEAGNAFWKKRPAGAAAELIDEAEAIAKGAPSAGLVYGHAVRTYLAVGRGDAPGAHAALGDLRRTFDRLPDHVTADHSGHGFPLEAVLWNETYVYTLLGDDRAGAVLDQALTTHPENTHGLANLELMRAVSLVRDRDVTEGLQHAVTTLAASGSVAGRHIAAHLLNTLPQKARTLPVAHELHTLMA